MVFPSRAVITSPGFKARPLGRFSVAGTSVPQGPQQYTLVTPEDAAANNQPPKADANGPYVTDEGTNATLNSGGSSDPDGDVLTFEWDLNYDGVTFDVDATGSNPNFDTVGDNDVFSIALRVTDPDGAFDLDDTLYDCYRQRVLAAIKRVRSASRAIRLR